MAGDLGHALTALTFCWTLERKDGAGLALTSHDAAIRLDGVDYHPAPGLRPAAIIRGSGDEPAGEAAGALTSDSLREADLISGRWDGAQSRLRAADWSRPDLNATILAEGELGDIVVQGDEFEADLLGPASRLKAPVCPTTTPECRAILGDKQCRVNMAGRTLRARVVEAIANEVTLDRPVPEQFENGMLRWLGGENCGLRSLVSSCSGNTLILLEAPRLDVGGGVQVLLYEGCDKRLATCRSRFANVQNFRGEPHLPGNDLLTRYPGA